MGLLIDGVWHDKGYDTKATGGAFVRADSQFRNWVTADGAAGPTGAGGFKASSGRYHLYVSYACPWAHRTLIYRALKGLAPHISVSIVHWLMGAEGWTFAPGDGVVADSVLGKTRLHEIYAAAKRDYTGRVTVPVLWDRATATIVNNESSEIIRMFGRAFDALPGVDAALDLCPAQHAAEIDAINDRVYRTVNNGVYRAGFAGTQAAYDEAVAALFETLDWLEARLATRRFLLGAAPTEADWRLFPTLLRFDPVYVLHFKCNKKRLVEYPNLWAYTRDLYQWPGVAATVRLDHIKAHYFASHRHLNPSGIVPLGPALDFAAPHGRARLREAA